MSGKIRLKNLVVDHTLSVNGSDLTSAVEELAVLDGLTASAAELNYNDITAPGTAQASKTVVLDASKGITGLGASSVGTSNTSGVVLTNSITNALQVVAEDGGVALTSGNQKAIKGRLFIKANPGDVTLEGILGQVKFNTNITASADYQSGVRGYLELMGGNTVNTGGANPNIGAGGYGVRGFITAAENLTISANHYLVGVGAHLSVTAAKSITATGKLVAFGVFADDAVGGATPTQAWGYGLYFPVGVAVRAGILNANTDGLYVNVAALTSGDAYSGLRSIVTANNNTNTYGAAGYFETDLTGTVAGVVYGFGSWVNLGASAVGGSNMICAQDNGIYVPTAGAPMASAKAVIGMRMEYVAEGGENPGSLFLFSTNIFSNALTAMFDINLMADTGGSATAATGNDYKIPFIKEASTGQVWYLNLYHA